MKKNKYILNILYILLITSTSYDLYAINKNDDISVILDLENDNNGNDDNLLMPNQIGQIQESPNAFDSFNQEDMLIGPNGARDDFDSSILRTSKNLRLNSLLMQAILAHDINKAKKIVKSNKKSIHYQNRDGQTALHLAALNNNSQLVTLLLNYGAAVNILDSLGRTPLHLASQNDSFSVAQILMNYNADPQLKDNDDKIPYDYASSEQMQDLLLI